MMEKVKYLVLILLISFVFVQCSDDDDPVLPGTLTLSINGLEELGPDYVYEGWLIVNGNAVTSGRFTVDGNGNLSQQNFEILQEILDGATTFVLTIEPATNDDPGPSDVHLVAGDFNGNTGSLSISHAAALNNDYSGAMGNYILATPTDDAINNEKSGIWFLDVSGGSPVKGLNLPDLPNGWEYEGWVVIDGVPVTTGKFINTETADDFDGFSETINNGPPFPGEDYLLNAPSGLNFPIDLSGRTAVISIEPVPDNSEAPFLLKPLVGQIPSDALDHTTYAMGQNLTFPTGSFSR